MKTRDKKIISLCNQTREVAKSYLDKIYDYRILAEILNFVSEKAEDLKKSPSAPADLDREKIIRKYANHLAAGGRKEKTVSDYCRGAERFLKYLEKNKIRIPALNQESAEEYLAGRKNSRLGNNSYAKEVILLRVFLRYLSEQKLVHLDPSKLKGPSRVRVLREYLREADIQKIIFYLDQRNETYKGQNLRDQVILYLGISCGLRTGEIIRLNWEDVRLKDCILKIISSKGGKSREVRFGPGLKDLLICYRRAFRLYKGAVVRGLQDRKRICATSLQNAVRKIYKGARVYRKGLNICSMRHTYCTSVNKKAGTAVASLAMGHSRIDTTQAYLHFEREDLDAAVIDMPQPLPSAHR